MDAEHILGRLTHHIQNNLPINLIYVPQMKLMDRHGMMRHAQSLVGAMEDTAGITMAAGSSAGSTNSRKFSAERTIQKIIKRKLSYAIMSHRWLQWGEVTYEEMLAYGRESEGRHDNEGEDGRSSRTSLLPSPGYWKLKKLCEMATKYGCDWAWADTCCINKLSSAELDESIRSMYRWYSNAEICIVHLASTNALEDMEKDAWFTRGWTLQELLASSRIKFVNKDWEPLLPEESNDKSDTEFLEAISRITEIPIFDLRRFTASTDRIREKMAWAAKRKTTRVEDVAYSLIGIFNVTLVVAYGEGDRAFYRLQLEIMGKTDSIDIFVWDGEPSHEHSMLAGGPACFTPIDREDEFTRLIQPGPTRSRSQCEEDARILIPRGSQTFSISNSSLRMQLVLYDINAGEPYGPDFAGWPAWIGTLNTEVQGELKLGILDYERDDVSGRRDAACVSLLQPEAMQTYWIRNSEAKHSISREKSMVLEEAKTCILQARVHRLYTAILLRPGEMRRHNLFRISAYGILRLSRPNMGWKPPETVYLM